MAELDRLSEFTEWFDLDSAERERTPREIIEKGICYHIAGLSLSDKVTLPEDLGAGEVESLFTTGCKRPIYSLQMGEARITLRLIRKRSESTTSNTGCTLLSIQE